MKIIRALGILTLLAVVTVIMFGLGCVLTLYIVDRFG